VPLDGIRTRWSGGRGMVRPEMGSRLLLAT
jgi:hypothetical protein